MAKTTTVEVWVAVDEDGRWDAGADRETAVERLDEVSEGGRGRRLVKLALTIPLPVVAELAADLAGDGDAVLVAAKAA